MAKKTLYVLDEAGVAAINKGLRKAGNIRGQGVRNTPDGVTIAWPPPAPEPPAPELEAVVRFKVTTGPGLVNPRLVKAKRYHGDEFSEGVSEENVACVVARGVNDEVYAARPVGGVDLTDVEGDLPTIWREVGSLGNPFVITLEQTGGAQGTQTAAATWSYSAKIYSSTIAVNLTPLKPRGAGYRTIATQGLARFSPASQGVELIEAWEAEDGEACG